MNAISLRSRLLIGVGLGVLTVAACTKENTSGLPASAPAGGVAPAATKPAEPAPTPTPTAPAANGGPDEASSGKVLETMNSGGYTYAKLDRGKDQVWVAGPEMKLAVGATVTTKGQMLMSNFHSDTLNRTFPELYFVSAMSDGGAGGAAAPAGAAGAAGAVAQAPGTETGAVNGQGMPVPQAPTSAGDKVEPIAGGVTIADVINKKKDLGGKDVVIRAKVIKYNAGIMGKDWLHIQDGTSVGSATDMTVTAEPQVKAPAVGSIVVVRGKVGLDKDFGAGYSYAVIVEDAKLSDK